MALEEQELAMLKYKQGLEADRARRLGLGKPPKDKKRKRSSKDKDKKKKDKKVWRSHAFVDCFCN